MSQSFLYLYNGRKSIFLGFVIAVTFVLVAKKKKKSVASNCCSGFSEQNRYLVFTYEAEQIVKITFKSTEVSKPLAIVRELGYTLGWIMNQAICFPTCSSAWPENTKKASKCHFLNFHPTHAFFCLCLASSSRRALTLHISPIFTYISPKIPLGDWWKL